MNYHRTLSKLLAFVQALAIAGLCAVVVAEELDYGRDIQPLLTKYCVGCHNAKEAEGGFVCEDYSGLMKGSKERVVVKESRIEQSVLLKILSGEEEPRMPPEDEAQLKPAELLSIRTWIEQGAKQSQQPTALRDRLKVASVAAKHHIESPVTAMHLVDDENKVALGSYNEVRLVGFSSGKVLQLWNDIVGKVTSIRPSHDGTKLVVASGVAGIGGQISIIDVASGKITQQLEGHRDSIFSAVLSPDGSLVASAGYDRRIILWDADNGSIVRTLEGHNGAVYDLDFHPSGKLLASCSGDETTKIWSVANGARLDTLSQGEAEQYCVRFTPDGKRIMAAGADRRIRVWRLTSVDREAINPMLHACFAHEKSIVAMRISPDGKVLVTASEDRTVKLWTARDLVPIGEVGVFDDVPSNVAWRSDGRSVVVATMSGKVVANSVENMLRDFSTKRTRVASLKSSPDESEQPLSVSLKDLAMESETIRSEREQEPNNSLNEAMSLNFPREVSGSIFHEGASQVDEDWFAFDAKAGQPWVIIASAASKESPLDPMLEVRNRSGELVVRTKLHAVRESYFTFRGKDSSTSDDYRMHRWEDMELNEYLYSGGEVVKLWLYPRGPDSGFKVYPGSGNRRTYFDTTARSHALGEPAWIVRELAMDELPVPNGLPTFTIYYENDDDATRQSGNDSRLIFTVPKEDRYFVRLRDARGLEGEGYEYKLVIRKQLMDYNVTATTKELAIPPGTGGEFMVSLDRLDDFEGPVDLTIDGLPEGVVVSQPLSIEEGQNSAFGTIFIPQDAAKLPEKFEFTIHASGMIYNQQVERRVKAPISVKVTTTESVKTKFAMPNKNGIADDIEEIVIHPGETISTFIEVERGKESGDIPFGKEDSGRNLPHGIFVSNIGLSGLVVKPGENTREVFITAAPWVESQTRPFHLKTTLKGNSTTKPILLRVEAP
ncbi:MAG: c-type cytochrome domain-containing protein [Pirellulaceae bacterium]|nr:c-type cytochrome domain-containing protein [Pirellulaceae bacterium]